jgi:hypothetical protein
VGHRSSAAHRAAPEARLRDGEQRACRTVVFGELDWSPGVHEQCVGRVYRDGQKEPVMAYYLIAEHGADPVIADVLQVKKAQADGIRDPHADLIGSLDIGTGNVRRLAEQFLEQRGIASAIEQSA